MHHRKTLRINSQNKKDGNYLWPRRALPYNNSVFAVPATWDFVVLKHKQDASKTHLIYLSNSTYYFTLTIPNATKLFRVSWNSNTFFVSQKFWAFTYTHYLSSLRHVFRMTYSVFFTKMKFKGKGYYIYKNFRNTITPKFGYYHRIYVYAFNVTVKFLSKTSVLLFGFSKQDAMTVGHTFKSKKPINVFTGRGVRFARQIIYRKTGKVSSYR